MKHLSHALPVPKKRAILAIHVAISCLLFLATFLSVAHLSALSVHAQSTSNTPTPEATNTETTNKSEAAATPTSTASAALSETVAISASNKMTTADALLTAGISNFEAEKFDVAESELQDAETAFAEADDEQGRGVALLYLGQVYVANGNNERARDALEQSVLIWESLSDFSQLLTTLQLIGNLHLSENNLEQAETTLTTALSLATQLGDEEAEAALTVQLGQVDFENNYESYNKDLDIAKKAGDGEKAASLLKKIGALYIGIGEFDDALTAFEDELAYRRELQQLDKIADVLKALGRIHEQQVSYEDAADAFAEAASIWEELKETEKAASLYKDLGAAYRKGDFFSEAAAAYTQEASLRQLIDDEKGEAEAYHNASASYLDANEPDEAAQALQMEIALWLALDADENARDAQIALARLHEQESAWAEAVVEYSAAISMTRVMTNEKLLADLLTDLGDIQVDLAQFTDAAPNYEEALALWQALDNPGDELKLLRRLGDLYRDLEEPTEAARYLQQALVLATDDVETEAKLYEDLGGSYRDLIATRANAAAQSIEAYQEALDRWQNLGDQESIMDTNKALGDLYYREVQEYAKALSYFSQALAIAEAEAWTEDEAYYLRRIADSYDKQEAYEAALTNYRNALALWQTLGNTEEATKIREDIVKAEERLAKQQLALRTESGIVEPLNEDTISGVVDIRGIANDVNFQKWQLDLLIDQDPNRATFLDVSRRAAPSVKRLMELDTTLYPNGTHTLRLRVVRIDFNYDEYFVTVTINN